jgi:uncharacterized protein (UPF0371 family)
VDRAKLLIEELGLKLEDRKVIGPARQAAQDAEKKKKGENSIFVGAAIELNDGTIVSGKNSHLMHAASSLIINAIKHLANIPDKIHLLSPNVLSNISNMKKRMMEDSESLDLEETLIALAMSASTNPTAEAAMERIEDLRGCEVHTTHMPSPGDEIGLKRLGVNLTADANFVSKNLFIT